MLSLFKKVITKVSELNEVQQNVFDTIQEIKSIDFCNLISVGSATGLASGTETTVGDPFVIANGDYVAEVEAYFNVTFSGVPTQIQYDVNLYYFNDQATPITTQSGVLVDPSGSQSSFYVRKSALVNSVGNKFIVRATITTTGGTVTSRDVPEVQVKTFRRFI